MSAVEIQERARGRWPFILRTLGIDVRTDGLHSPCPTCGGKDRFRSDDQDGRGTWFCNQCDPQAGDGFALVQNVRKCDFKEAVKLVEQALRGASHAPLPARSSKDEVKSNIHKKPVTRRTNPPEGVFGETLFGYSDDLGRPYSYVQRVEENGVKRFYQ